ncbi:MAG: DUF1844 domain-containing protein [Thermoguttaceae bacterium]
MTAESNQPEKKIIIDEDWKSQVQAEKEAARQSGTSDKPASGQQPSGSTPPLPPADFTFLIGTLYLQGAMALGLIPNPIAKKSVRQPDHAKHAIDMLAMLQEKTEGNRTPEESSELENVLHELRMAFIGVSESAKDTGPKT